MLANISNGQNETFKGILGNSLYNQRDELAYLLTREYPQMDNQRHPFGRAANSETGMVLLVW